jgi:2-C-methyl-D-erythritol 2,4-cyclodiphosphate synthase
MQRIGHGYDVHRLVSERKLILGGVEIEHPLGMLGHSDADVLLHAICDAILGAVAEGDIGRHFPDTEPAFRGADSLKLLAEVLAIAGKRHYLVSNIDATIIAQRPKLAPYIRQMVENIAAVCEIDIRQVNVKATTTEELGFTGREQGIAAHAVVLMKSYVPNDSEVDFR